MTQRPSPRDVTVNRAVPIRPGDGATSATAATSKLFAAAFAQSKNVMALVDARRQIVDANAACVKLVGYERSAMIGQPVYQFVAGGPVLSPAAWRAALKEGQFTGPEIADQLQIAHDTVRTHVRNAMVKMDARSRAHLVAKTLGNGLAWGEG